MTEGETETKEAAESAYQGWAIVELMGHRQTAGKVAEVVLAGATMLRVDSPGPDGEMIATQFYGGAAIYCMTPCEEATAKRLLADRPHNLPPAVRLVLPEPTVGRIEHRDEDDYEDVFDAG